MTFDTKKIIDEVCSKGFWLRILVMILSIFLLAMNYNLFFLKNSLVVGGTSGVATIINSYTGLSPGTFMLIFNVSVCTLSFFLLGPRQTGLAIVGSVLYPIFVSLTSGLCDVIAEKLVFDDFLIVIIISGLLYGIANGFIYRTGFSTGGVDILIQIINKYFKIPRGTSSLMTNIVIICAGAMIFGTSKAVYAVIIIFMNSTLVDKIMLGISDSKMFYINTSKSEQVQKVILDMNTGYTVIKTIGSYDNRHHDIIMCVIANKDYYILKNVVQTIDPDAFFIINDCYQVYGGRRKARFPFI